MSRYLVILFAFALFQVPACGLNPQPEPPAGNDRGNDAGSPPNQSSGGATFGMGGGHNNPQSGGASGFGGFPTGVGGTSSAGGSPGAGGVEDGVDAGVPQDAGADAGGPADAGLGDAADGATVPPDANVSADADARSQ